MTSESPKSYYSTGTIFAPEKHSGGCSAPVSVEIHETSQGLLWSGRSSTSREEDLAAATFVAPDLVEVPGEREPFARPQVNQRSFGRHANELCSEPQSKDSDH